MPQNTANMNYISVTWKNDTLKTCDWLLFSFSRRPLYFLPLLFQIKEMFSGNICDTYIIFVVKPIVIWEDAHLSALVWLTLVAKSNGVYCVHFEGALWYLITIICCYGGMYYGLDLKLQSEHLLYWRSYKGDAF